MLEVAINMKLDFCMKGAFYGFKTAAGKKL